MKIFVMRHGEAEVMANSDKERRLTSRGRLQVSERGYWLKTVIPDFDKVLVSPYRRAVESFEKIDEAYHHQLSSKQEIWEGITPYGSSHLVIDYLSVLANKGVDKVLIVSHLPLVWDIVTELCSKRSPISFYPSTIVGLQWDCEQSAVITEIKYPE
ncbi:phosphohistidine phosphatase SixA [Histophilus somni]|uniref:Phosphohistidine phosphatase SixA n=2 Tax=Histophilus somni TaxID=731 RepID=A0A9Q6YZJ8_HISSO|nr:phosphohistidine phosphatase SixA [Histophilus somni]ACA30920.1 phosphohistidine phosphatase, SixA [Histophilus somni 2336]ARU65048.1 phosphohistidine phosphatase SixA [Histophilus somni]ARU66914.1 phosphohistidine phosphatase SixA [Histophilus somni]ARU68785.1 phosphohistidine phosphatase SixA [Histophilus somni]ARU70667.1 phosphohistidine phosphatase SixA [Histophilus somni]